MPKTPSLASLGSLILNKRGKVGVRVTAKEIGISPATLSRVENGHLPDLDNFQKICHWVGIDPSTLLGFNAEELNRPSVSVHFRNEKTMSLATGSALSEMIQAAQHALVAQARK